MMAIKGFIKTCSRAGDLHREIEALMAAGVPLESIAIGESVSASLEGMEAGDVLTLQSLALCDGIRGAEELLTAAVSRGVTVRTLAEGFDTSEAPADWASAARMFRRIEWQYRSELSRAALRGSKTVGGRGAGRPKSERLKRGLCRALAEYYATGRSVGKICSGQGFDASVLYRCIDQNGLPRRRDMADDSTRHPFAGGKELRVRLGDKWVSIRSPETAAGKNLPPADSMPQERSSLPEMQDMGAERVTGGS